jgi:hypothetical protein
MGSLLKVCITSEKNVGCEKDRLGSDDHFEVVVGNGGTKVRKVGLFSK